MFMPSDLILTVGSFLLRTTGKLLLSMVIRHSLKRLLQRKPLKESDVYFIEAYMYWQLNQPLHADQVKESENEVWVVSEH